ncbi:hypothetical protein FKM82_001068 [Ascaphus truei]
MNAYRKLHHLLRSYYGHLASWQSLPSQEIPKQVENMYRKDNTLYSTKKEKKGTSTMKEGRNKRGKQTGEDRG